MALTKGGGGGRGAQASLILERGGMTPPIHEVEHSDIQKLIAITSSYAQGHGLINVYDILTYIINIIMFVSLLHHFFLCVVIALL